MSIVPGLEALALRQGGPYTTIRADRQILCSGFEGWLCQTIRAHRLLRKAYMLGGQELQEKVLEAIFYAYFTEGKNIADIHFLGELAEEAGVFSKDEVRCLRYCCVRTDDALLLPAGRRVL